MKTDLDAFYAGLGRTEQLGWTPGPDWKNREHCAAHGRWTRLGEQRRACPECPKPKHEQDKLFEAPETMPGQMVLP